MLILAGTPNFMPSIELARMVNTYRVDELRIASNAIELYTQGHGSALLDLFLHPSTRQLGADCATVLAKTGKTIDIFLSRLDAKLNELEEKSYQRK